MAAKRSAHGDITSTIISTNLVMHQALENGSLVPVGDGALEYHHVDGDFAMNQTLTAQYVNHILATQLGSMESLLPYQDELPRRGFVWFDEPRNTMRWVEDSAVLRCLGSHTDVPSMQALCSFLLTYNANETYVICISLGSEHKRVAVLTEDMLALIGVQDEVSTADLDVFDSAMRADGLVMPRVREFCTYSYIIKRTEVLPERADLMVVQPALPAVVLAGLCPLCDQLAQ